MPRQIGQPAVIQSLLGLNGNQNPLPFTITSLGGGITVNGVVNQDGSNPDNTATDLYVTGVSWYSTSAAAVAAMQAGYVDGGPDVLVCYDVGT